MYRYRFEAKKILTFKRWFDKNLVILIPGSDLEPALDYAPDFDPDQHSPNFVDSHITNPDPDFLFYDRFPTSQTFYIP